MQTLLLIHAAATLYMTGLIWFVQLVHYPLMAKVGDAGYRAYQRLHEQRTTLAVAPAMLIEIAAAIWLAINTPDTIAPPLAWLGLALCVAIWLSTFLLQVPCHKQLGQGFNPTTHRRLVCTNWLRTVLWSARSAVALSMLAT